jgi:DNA-binding CsgD family transcriptional regulator
MILVVFDELPALQPPNARDVAGVAGLTRAEFEVMASLLQGLPAKAIAARRSAAVNTVRSQISTILQKTGHNSQKELIASFGNSSSFQDPG